MRSLKEYMTSPSKVEKRIKMHFTKKVNHSASCRDEVQKIAQTLKTHQSVFAGGPRLLTSCLGCPDLRTSSEGAQKSMTSLHSNVIQD